MTSLFGGIAHAVPLLFGPRIAFQVFDIGIGSTPVAPRLLCAVLRAMRGVRARQCGCRVSLVAETLRAILRPLLGANRAQTI